MSQQGTPLCSPGLCAPGEAPVWVVESFCCGRMTYLGVQIGVTGLWSGSAGRWSAVLSAPPSPELLSCISLSPGYPRHHVCPDSMSGEPHPSDTGLDGVSTFLRDMLH